MDGKTKSALFNAPNALVEADMALDAIAISSSPSADRVCARARMIFFK